MKTAAAVTATAATAATLALCVPILGVLLTKTGSGAVAGYLGHLFRKRSRLRDSSTAGEASLGAFLFCFRKLSSGAAPDC